MFSVGQWTQNFVLPRMPVCGVYMCYMFITQRVHGRFYGRDLKKGNGRLGKLATDH